MKAIVVTNDKSLIWQEVDDPQVKDGEVLIEIYATAINRADLLQKAGVYPPPAGSPEWMGLEVSGVIKKLSPKAKAESSWQIGDQVCALLGGGGYAEYVAIDHRLVLPIPKGLSMVEAAALPEAFATAYLNLFVEGKAKKGEHLLLPAGNSGLASVLISLAKAFGLRVTTTVRSQAKAQAIAHLPFDQLIDTSQEDVVEVLRKEADLGRPVNIVIDCLGSPKVGESMEHVAYGCRWLVIGTLAGETTPLNLNTLLRKNIQLMGNTLRSKTVQQKAEILKQLVQTVWPMIESGDVLPTIFARFPITKAQQAQALLEAGESAGKVVLVVKESS